MWQSPDPILASYLGGSGSGNGVFTPKNLNLYGYVQQNPVRLFDPNGMETVDLSWDGFQAHVSNQWQNLKADVGNAAQNPGQAAIGALKGFGNAAHGLLWYNESGPYPTGLSALCGYCGSEAPFALNSAERGGALITGAAAAAVGARQALRTEGGGRWLDANGRPNWPPNDGFAGTPSRQTLTPGERIDRYGEPTGGFLSPAGTPYGQRALAPGSETRTLRTYEVVKPFDVDAGRIAPWFDEVGGGTQYQLLNGQNVQNLMDAGFLRVVE